MDKQSQYILALGAFRQESSQWSAMARQLAAASTHLDPSGSVPADAAALQVMSDVAAEFRALAVLFPGIRQLFSAAVGGI